MNLRLFLTAFLLLCRMVLYCQADSVKKEPYVYFNAVSVIAGFTSTEYQSQNLDHFKGLSPGNSITRSIPDGTKERASNGNSANTMLNLGVNIHLKTKDFKTPLSIFSSEWRVGVNIASTIAEKAIYSKRTISITDSSEMIYQYKFRSKNVYFDMTKTYHTNQLRPFSFYAGINFGIGYTFNNYLDVSSVYDSLYMGAKYEHYYHMERYYDHISYERTTLGNEIYYNASIPIGIIYRLVKKKKQTAYRFSVFAEARFGYSFQKKYTPAYNKIPLCVFQAGTKLYFKRRKTNS